MDRSGKLPAVRIGRRVRVRRAELDRILAQGSTTMTAEEQPSPAAPDEPSERLAQALDHAWLVLGRGTVPRRHELVEALQELADASRPRSTRGPVTPRVRHRMTPSDRASDHMASDETERFQTGPTESLVHAASASCHALIRSHS